MVAPRALLLTEAYEDRAANPAGTYCAAQAARDVYQLLNAGEKIGWAFREGGHDHQLPDYQALLEFMKLHIPAQIESNSGLHRNFQRRLYPDLKDHLYQFQPD